MLVAPPSATPRCRSSVLSAALALFALSGCVGAVGESPSDPVEASPSRDAGHASKRDARVAKPASSESSGTASYDPTGAVSTDDPASDTTERAPKGPDANSLDAGVPVDAATCSEPPLATDLKIREISLYQTIKVPLYKDGAWVTSRVAPVVQKKKAMVRVFVTRLAGYQPRMLHGVLTLADGATNMQLTDDRMLSADSTDEQLTSTFTFQIDGAQLGDTTQFSVAIQETSCAAGSSVGSAPNSTSKSVDGGSSAGSRFPATGTRSLDTTKIGKLKVVIVPINVNSRLPVTTDDEVTKIRAALHAYYPVPEVDVSVRAPMMWSVPVDGSDGNAWSDVLNAVMSERRKDAPSSDTYYFGLMQPAATFKAYCSRGCILGLAPQTTMVQPSAQVGLGASFADAQTYETVVHELGHAHGRGHAPCVMGGDIQGVDPQFPNRTGTTDTWGWDNRSNVLMPPTDKDIMGYCQPNWISQYNYSAIATRSVAVNLKALMVGPKSADPWQHVLLYGDGSARWGGSTETEQPGGMVEQVDVLDAQGNVVDQTEVVRIPLSHSSSEFVYIRQPKAGWASLKLSDRVLVLSEILPAL